jgi:hypothetical protein
VRSPRSRGAGNSGEEEEQFEENVKEAHDIIAQLETLVNKMETKRHTKRRTARASRSRDSTPADSKAHINANRGSSSEGKGKERQGKPYAVSPSALLGGGSRGTTTTITTQTSGPKLISLPPGGADKPIGTVVCRVVPCCVCVSCRVSCRVTYPLRASRVERHALQSGQEGVGGRQGTEP